MNIGIFTDTYTPQVNGVVTVIRMLKAGLEKEGHKVYIFTVRHPDAVYEERVYRVMSWQFPKEPQHRIGLFTSKWIDKIVKKLNLDIIHSHTEFSLFLIAQRICRKYKIPSVHTLHSYWIDYLHYLPKPLKIFFTKYLGNFLKFLFRKQQCVISPSRKNADYLADAGLKRPIQIIPNGIDLSHFYDRSESLQESGRQFRERCAIAPNEDMIVFVGRLGAEKNIPVLMENFQKIVQKRNAKLVIVGDGPDRKLLENYAAELGIKNTTVFTGYLKWPEEIKVVYAGADMFMSASHSEVHPITFIEAMAAGLPVVAAADKSIDGMVINGDNGWALEDDSKMWEKAVEVFNDPAECKKMGKRSEELSKNYDLDRFTENMLVCYKTFTQR